MPEAVMIILVGLVVVGIVVWVVRGRRWAGAGPGRGVHSLRRGVQYSFLLAALFAAATGLSRLLAAALPAAAMAGRRTTDVALGLSLTLVAVPAWLLLWRLVSRRLVEDAEERASAGWPLYLVAAVSVTLVVAYVQLVQAGRWVVGIDTYEPDAIAFGLVWAAVWGVHTWLLRHPRLGPTGPLPELALAAGWVVGLVALAVGAGGVLRYGLDELYGVLAGPALVEGVRTEALRHSLVVGALALPVWWWHWLRQGVRAPRTSLWHLHVMLVAVLGGLLTLVVATGVGLHAALQWFFGLPEAATAAVHFEPVPGALAAAVVGGWAWWYHHAVLAQAADRTRTEPERAYGHLVAGVGLVAAGAGVTVALMAALQALTPGALASADRGGRNTLVVALTLLLLGAPLWWAFWRRLQARVASGDLAELRSPSRRAYLVLLFGLTGLTAVISTAVILFVVFRDLLEGSLAITVLHDLRAAIGLVLTAGGVSAYHWLVHRADARSAPADEPIHPRTVLLVSPDGRQLADAVAAGTGASVRRLHRLDARPAPVDEETADAVSAAVLAAHHERVLVTVEADGVVRVIPYDLD
jgi:hypothetical protein